jgi:hypothetical protein
MIGDWGRTYFWSLEGFSAACRVSGGCGDWSGHFCGFLIEFNPKLAHSQDF